MSYGRHNIELGRWGERLAETMLVKKGATILARNYRSDPGEIDLIVEHEGDIVAVEVKTRTELDLEKPEEAISWAKLRRMRRGLETFALNNAYDDRHWRLDVVAVELTENGDLTRCQHIRDAYGG